MQILALYFSQKSIYLEKLPKNKIKATILCHLQICLQNHRIFKKILLHFNILQK